MAEGKSMVIQSSIKAAVKGTIIVKGIGVFLFKKVKTTDRIGPENLTHKQILKNKYKVLQLLMVWKVRKASGFSKHFYLYLSGFKKHPQSPYRYALIVNDNLKLDPYGSIWKSSPDAISLRFHLGKIIESLHDKDFFEHSCNSNKDQPLLPICPEVRL